MKIARIIGLAVITTIVITAWAGTGSALAAESTLCKATTNSPYCVSADRYPAETMLKASVGALSIETNLGNISCTGSNLEGKTSTEAGTPLLVSIPSWALNGCKYGGKSCSVTTEHLPYSATLTSTGSTDGALTVGNSGKGAPGWAFNCVGMECTMTFEPSGMLKGGNAAQLVVNKGTLNRKGFLCPATATFPGATLVVDSPNPAYVATAPLEQAHTRLCKVALSPCPASDTYPPGTLLEAEAPSMEIVTLSAAIHCGKTTISAKSQAIGAEPLPLGSVGFTTKECSGGFLGSCEITPANTGAEISQTGIYTGSFRLIGSWNLHCGGGTGFTCTLRTNEAVAQFTGQVDEFTPARFVFNNALLTEQAGFCPGNPLLLRATFTVTSPKPLLAT